MENELFSILEDDAQDRNTHRACLRAVARANKQFSAFFKQAASDDDYMARFELVRDRVSDIVREACIEEGSTSLDTVARVLAGELARLSEVERGTPQDEDVAPSDGEDDQMHVRGLAGRKLLGLDDQEGESKTAVVGPPGDPDRFRNRALESDFPRGGDDAWLHAGLEELTPEEHQQKADQALALIQGGGIDEQRRQHLMMWHQRHQQQADKLKGQLGTPWPETDTSQVAPGQTDQYGVTQYEASVTAAPRRAPTPKMDQGSGRMYQPAKNPPRKKKAPADPNAKDSLDPMKNKNVVRTPGGNEPLDKPVNQQQLDWNEKNKNKVRGESLHDAPTGKSLRELEGLAPLRPGELKADDEAAFLRAQSAAEPETGDTYSQERVDLPAAGPNGVSEDPSPKMDKGTAGDEQHTFQKPVVVDSEKGNVQQQDIHDKADYTKKLEPSGVLQSIDAEKGIQPELNPGPDTDTWSGTKDQANPVTSKWKVLG